MNFKTVSFNFSNKRALVIGGSRGIGQELIFSLLSSGCEVFYASRNPMVEKSQAIFIETDIRSESCINDLFLEIKKYGNIDFVVNMAAINECKKIEDIDTNEWDEILSVNLRAAYIVCKESAKIMKQVGAGRIINVSSIAGRHRSPVSGVHYVSSKAGLIGLTKQLAFELGPFGICVNAVCPSQTLTEMLLNSMDSQQRANLAESIPLRRIADIKDQVGPIMFLCSDAACYINGAVIDINGGQI